MDFIFDEETIIAVKKIGVAIKQINEDKMFDLWSKSMSGKSFDDWKKQLKTDAQQKESGGISGKDLAQM